MLLIQSIGKTAIRNWNTHNQAMAKAVERLSSGKRINRAADDACGLAISEKMKAQLSQIDIEKENAISRNAATNTTDGIMSNIQNALQRMKELATQAISGTLSSSDRNALNIEYQGLLEDVNRMGQSISGSKTKSLFTTKNMEAEMSDSVSYTSTNPNSFLDAINTYVTENKRNFSSAEDLHKAVADYAKANAQLLLNTPDQTGGLNCTVYISSHNVVIQTAGFSTDTLHVTGTNLLSEDSANQAIDALKDALDVSSAYRSDYGATQSSLDHTIEALQEAEDQLNQSISRIVDADMAKELMHYTQQSMLTQTATFVMTQCNLQAKTVLQLLK